MGSGVGVSFLWRFPIRRFPDEEGTEIALRVRTSSRWSGDRSEDSPMRRGLKLLIELVPGVWLDIRSEDSPMRRGLKSEHQAVGAAFDDGAPRRYASRSTLRASFWATSAFRLTPARSASIASSRWTRRSILT